MLVALGTWQLQRLAWKEGLIRQIAERVHAPPAPLAELDRRLAAGEDVEYLRVRLGGRFDHGREIHLYSPGEGGWGWHVITPLAMADGRRLLVNRGYVPNALADPARRRDGLPAGEVEVTGLVRRPATAKPWFGPDNDTGRNQWYWPDLPAMAAAAGGGESRFLIEAEAGPADAPLPRGGVTRLELESRHLEYALTWYGLAAALAGVFAGVLWSRRHAGG